MAGGNIENLDDAVGIPTNTIPGVGFRFIGGVELAGCLTVNPQFVHCFTHRKSTAVAKPLHHAGYRGILLTRHALDLLRNVRFGLVLFGLLPPRLAGKPVPFRKRVTLMGECPLMPIVHRVA